MYFGDDASKTFDGFEQEEGEDDTEIGGVLAKMEEYCEPRTMVAYAP